MHPPIKYHSDVNINILVRMFMRKYEICIKITNKLGLKKFVIDKHIILIYFSLKKIEIKGENCEQMNQPTKMSQL